MASVKKFTSSQVFNQLRHNERTIYNSSNPDIDSNKIYKNYSLAPDRRKSAYGYFKERKAELYCYGRADVKVLCGWVVTAPKDLKAEQQDAFFQSTHDFLITRYGEANCIQSIVHQDESGQPHLHYCFIPTVPDPKHGGEKICANDVLDREELRTFHPDLQKHLQKDGIDAKVLTGITKEQGGNMSVHQLKSLRNIQREQEKKMERGRW